MARTATTRPRRQPRRWPIAAAICAFIVVAGVSVNVLRPAQTVAMLSETTAR